MLGSRAPARLGLSGLASLTAPWPLLQELICLRAIRDVNVPKFLQEDLKLFSGIVCDLFPTIKEEGTDYGVLDKAVRRACEKNNLQDVDGEPGATEEGWLQGRQQAGLPSLRVPHAGKWATSWAFCQAAQGKGRWHSPVPMGTLQVMAV